MYLTVVAFLTSALLCVASTGVGADDIYKSTDAQGRPIYSDRPLSPSAERVVIPRSGNAAAGQARTDEVQAINERLEALRQQTEAGEARKRAALQDEQRAKERCRQARDRYLMFAEGRRIYRRDEQGARVYYTGSEIDAERKAAEKTMNELCRDSQAPAPLREAD